MLQTVIAGDTLDFCIASQGYPATAGWALKLRMVPQSTGGTAIVLNGQPDADRYRVTAPPSMTARWAPGAYNWGAWVQIGDGDDADRRTLERGQIVVDANPETMAAGADLRSATQKALEAVQAMIRGRASAGVQSYVINGRELRYYGLAEMVKLESRLKAELASERAAAGLTSDGSGRSKRILVRLR